MYQMILDNYVIPPLSPIELKPRGPQLPRHRSPGQRAKRRWKVRKWANK